MISRVQPDPGGDFIRRTPPRFIAARLLTVVLLGCALAPFPARAQQEDSWEEDFQSAPPPGKRTFTSTCAGCHGLDGRGGPDRHELRRVDLAVGQEDLAAAGGAVAVHDVEPRM